jgi:hypothetical protein
MIYMNTDLHKCADEWRKTISINWTVSKIWMNSCKITGRKVIMYLLKSSSYIPWVVSSYSGNKISPPQQISHVASY